MNFISFNIRGLGGDPNHASFKRLLDGICLFVVFLHETLTSGICSCDLFLHLRPRWYVSVIDALGHSRGTLVAWDPLVYDLKDFNTCVGILISLKLKGMDLSVILLNVYGRMQTERFFGIMLRLMVFYRSLSSLLQVA